MNSLLLYVVVEKKVIGDHSYTTVLQFDLELIAFLLKKVIIAFQGPSQTSADFMEKKEIYTYIYNFWRGFQVYICTICTHTIV